MTSQWMVRSPQLQITGPYSKEELTTKIKAGEFSGEFEVCAGNHYWFYLNETGELESQLGITLPAHLLSTPAVSAEEAEGEITEEFPDESSQTSHINTAAIKPAPLAPRENRSSGIEPPPMVRKSANSSLIKIVFALIVAIALFLILKSR